MLRPSGEPVIQTDGLGRPTMRVADLVAHHDDGCTARLQNGFCPACKYWPDMQSIVLVFYCPSCLCVLQQMHCPQCQERFQKP